MNYLKAYCNLIRKAEKRTLTEGYVEKHHIFPKSIFGNNNKLVVLTAREHYIAHALLEKVYIKRYGLKNNKTIKMITAFWCMNNQNTRNEYFNSYLYEASRIRFINSVKGKKLTESHRQKMSETNSGKIWWTDGIGTKHSKECPGEGWYKGRPNINIGRVMSEDAKKKIGEKNRGRKLTNKHKEKISKELKTRRWWNNGIEDKHTAECPGNGWVLGRTMESWCKGKKNIFSKEAKDKIIERMLKYEYTIKNPEGKIYVINNLSKFCKENRLTMSCMRRVIRGIHKQHKGWTSVTVKELSKNCKTVG
jgi:hypothetical protein